MSTRPNQRLSIFVTAILLRRAGVMLNSSAAFATASRSLAADRTKVRAFLPYPELSKSNLFVLHFQFCHNLRERRRLLKPLLKGDK